MGESAEVIDGKGVARLHGMQRMRIYLEAKGINRKNAYRLEGQKVWLLKKKRMRKCLWARSVQAFARRRYGGTGGEKSFNMLAWNYDFVNTRVSD